METVAVYAEHPIKTYGIKAESGFVLLRAGCGPDSLSGCLQKAADCGELSRAVFSTSCRQPAGWQLCALIQADQAEQTKMALAECGLDTAPLDPVSLIHLQGPHFGDRYGLLAAVYKGLETGGVKPIIIQACMHSIFIVIPPDMAESAVQGLNQQFCAPG